MIIEKAEVADLQQILELQYLAYQSEAKRLNNPDIPPLKQTIFDIENDYHKGTILKAIDKNHVIVGSVRFYYVNDTVYIGKLMVHPDRRRQGIGTELLLEIEKKYPAPRYELFTSTESIYNIAMYQKLGYKIFDEKQITDGLRYVYLEKRM